MRLSSVFVIRMLWCFALVSAVVGAQSPPPFPSQISPVMAATVILMPILFFGAAAFWMAHSPFYHPRLAQLIDRRFGDGALASFLVRLRPLLLFGAAAAVQGLLGIVQIARAASSADAYLPSAFFISGGLGFALAHFVLYRRKVIGVYAAPSGTESAPVAPSSAVRASLGASLRRYWWALIGIALFPSAAFVGGDVLHIAFEYFALPFFAASFLAAWPWFSGRAPYSFWLVAVVVYMLGGFLAVLLVQLVRAAAV
jgi:hypothetical protein